MKRVSKQVAFFALCGVIVTGFLGGISTSEASALQLNNNVSQSQLYTGHELLQLDGRHDDRRGHHRYRHHDDGDGGGGGGDDLVTGVVIGAIVGSIIANN